MARVGGRNALIAWVVGIGCAAIIGVLAVLAAPLIPASFDWFHGTVGDAPTTSAPVATGDAGAGAAPADCQDLYDSSLLAELRYEPGSALAQSRDAPETTATALVAALQPAVTLTCSWHADAGTVSTTLATVPTDAGAIASAALPAAGFSCETQGARTRCVRTDGELTETIEAGGGVWLSTSEDGWHPSGYVRRTADRVWSDADGGQ